MKTACEHARTYLTDRPPCCVPMLLCFVGEKKKKKRRCFVVIGTKVNNRRGASMCPLSPVAFAMQCPSTQLGGRSHGRRTRGSWGRRSRRCADENALGKEAAHVQAHGVVVRVHATPKKTWSKNMTTSANSCPIPLCARLRKRPETPKRNSSAKSSVACSPAGLRKEQWGLRDASKKPSKHSSATTNRGQPGHERHTPQ